MTVTKRPEVLFVIVALACLIAVVVLTLANKPVPEYLWLVFTGAMTGGLGIATPAGSSAAGAVAPSVSNALASIEAAGKALLAAATVTATPPVSPAAATPPEASSPTATTTTTVHRVTT